MGKKEMNLQVNSGSKRNANAAAPVKRRRAAATAGLFALITVLVLGTISLAFADDLVNTVPADEGYTDKITTYHHTHYPGGGNETIEIGTTTYDVYIEDGTKYVRKENPEGGFSYYEIKSDGTVDFNTPADPQPDDPQKSMENPAVTTDTIVNDSPAPKNVRQSTSTTSATTFAAGMPLSTIYIDQEKIKTPTNGVFYRLGSDYSSGIIFDSNTGKVNYDAVNGPKKLYAGTVNVLEGDLYYVLFPDAAVLPDGSRADLKITYSNARIIIDQRYAYDNRPYNGQVFLSTGGSFSYGGTDPTRISGLSGATAREAMVNGVAQEYGNSFVNSTMNNPMIGKTMDATYQIVSKKGVPIDGTFIYAIAGINLDRDPYRGTSGNGYGKPLWYINGLSEETYNDGTKDYTVYKAEDGTKYIRKDTADGEKFFKLNYDGDNVTVAETPADPQPEDTFVSYTYTKDPATGKSTGGEKYHYFSEAMSITGGQASDYIYVRSNDNDLGDGNE